VRLNLQRVPKNARTRTPDFFVSFGAAPLKALIFKSARPKPS